MYQRLFMMEINQAVSYLEVESGFVTVLFVPTISSAAFVYLFRDGSFFDSRRENSS